VYAKVGAVDLAQYNDVIDASRDALIRFTTALPRREPRVMGLLRIPWLRRVSRCLHLGLVAPLVPRV
jgi:hypothetical protein